MIRLSKSASPALGSLWKQMMKLECENPYREEFVQINSMDRETLCPACWESLQCIGHQICHGAIKTPDGLWCLSFHKDA